MIKHLRVLLVLFLCPVVPASSLGHVMTADNELQVEPNFNVSHRIAPDTPISFSLSRALTEGDGRIAVVIGQTDVTSLFVVSDLRFTYLPGLVLLPLGTSEVLFYRVDLSGGWVELNRFSIEVFRKKPYVLANPGSSQQDESTTKKPTATVRQMNLGDSGTGADTTPQANTTTATAIAAQPSSSPAPAETPAASRASTNESRIKFMPTVTIGLKSQMAQFNFPANTRPAQRATFADGTLQVSLRTEGSRGPFSSQAQMDFAGSTVQAEALRFGTLGSAAPNIDLASYLAQFQIKQTKISIGHVSFGAARHLVSSFSSRGITVTVPITKRFDFSVAGMNGTSVVGYNNFFGLSKSKHQIGSATLGVEVLPKRPGALRLEFSGLTAYVQALNSFSQGSVNDVERSRGGAVRLLFTDKSQRLKFEGGFSRSQYRNPADPLLYQGTNTIAVPFLTRNARYLDVSYEALRNFELTKSRQVSLTVAVRHEQVDPLFKSLGASAQPDKLQNEFQVTGNIGEVSFQAGNTRFNDNLRRIPSILRSLARSNRFSVAGPAAVLFGETSNKSELLPRLSYSFDRTHQSGVGIPINGGFGIDLSLIPDQYSTNQTFSADWQIKKLAAGYNYNRSFTDNQQPGRGLSDFRNQTHAVRVGFNPLSTLNLNCELNRDAASDLESQRLNGTWRLGSTASWNVNKHMVWTGGISNTIAGDHPGTNNSRNTEFNTQFSYRIGLERGGLKKVQTQIFIRYADRFARQRDLLIGATNLTRVRTFNGGMTITLF